jgi:hypothetical protein
LTVLAAVLVVAVLLVMHGPGLLGHGGYEAGGP